MPALNLSAIEIMSLFSTSRLVHLSPTFQAITENAAVSYEQVYDSVCVAENFNTTSTLQI